MRNFKKALSVLLTVLLVATIIPFSALTTVSAETVKIGYITDSGVNIRKGPSTSSESVSKVSKWIVTVTGSAADSKGTVNKNTNKTYIWYKIEYFSSGATVTGYVREDLIQITVCTLDSSFESQLSAFPKSYHSALILLHAIYPNWKFTADNVNSTFSKAVTSQDTAFRKLASSNAISHRSMRNGCYNWEKETFIKTDSGKYGASREVIAYYMDPRNYLNGNDIYVFMQQSYDSATQNVDGVKKIVNGTFLDAKITDKNDKYYNKTYSEAIVAASVKSNVNPYILASTIILEQGRSGSTLSKGSSYNNTTVYNFFNYGATGSTEAEVLKNGKKYAYNNDWNTPSEAIIGGAVKYGANYIAKGQDTYYYKNWNVLDMNNLWHQYAQNVSDSLSSSRILKSNYIEQKNIKLTFRIPVFEELPSDVSKYPKENDNLNNYYFTEIKVNGLSPDFNTDTTSYSLSVNTDTDIYINVPTDAVYKSEYSFALTKGINTVKLKIKSQSGYSTTYKLTVTADTKCTLNIKQIGGTLIEGSDGKLHYYINGEKNNTTTLVRYNGELMYVKNGVFAKETTLVKYCGELYYVKDGKWKNTTTFVKYNNSYRYVKNGIFNKYTGFVKSDGKYYYVKNGVRSTDTKFVKYNNKYYYIKSGVRSSATGFIKYNGKYYQLKNGIRTTSKTFTKYNNLYLRLSKTEYTYNGKLKKPDVLIFDSKGNQVSSKYYTVKYSYGRKNVGKYKVTVTFRKKYSGTKKLYFTILPQDTTVKKVTATNNKLKVTLNKKTAQTTGYQIQYSVSSNFDSPKTKTVKSYKTATATLSGLKSETKYYVRVRTYKTVNGTKYYSDWSDYKSKKTLKTVYTTKTGKKYHYLKSCAGKNAVSTDINSAKSKFQPCKKCAK